MRLMNIWSGEHSNDDDFEYDDDDDGGGDDEYKYNFGLQW